jgi:hypothetical protein
LGTAIAMGVVMWLQYPAVPRGVLGVVVLLAALPFWAMVRGIDRFVFGHSAFASSPKMVPAAVVVLLSAAVAGAIGVLVRTVASLFGGAK